MIARNSVRITAMAAALVFAAACDRAGPTSPNVRAVQASGAVTLPTTDVQHNVWVCKDAPSGTFDFTVTGTGVTNAAPAIDAGTCTQVAASQGNVTVTELSEPGYLFDHKDVYTMELGGILTGPVTSFTTSFSSNFGDRGFIIVYFNVLEPSSGCTLTQGFWKNHPSDWPVTSLTLGTVTYTQAQLLSILKQPVKGNGLVSLAHQLIAAKLNVAAGATSNTIAATIASADAIIGGLVVPPVGSGSLSTSSVGSLVTALDQFNQGLAGPTHCGSDTPRD